MARCELDVPGRMGALEVLEVESLPAGDGEPWPRWNLTLVGFEPGVSDIADLQVRVVNASDGSTRIERVAAASVEVRLVEAGPGATLRPNTPPLDPGPDWRVVAGWAIAALLLAALALLAARWWRGRGRRRESPEPAFSAERAIAAIREVERSPALTPNAVLDSYHRLSDAVRRYLGLPLEVPVVALTSTEIVRAIDRVAGGRPNADANARHIASRHREVREWLDHVDEVKFGGARPEEATRVNACRRAIALVRDLERELGTGGHADVA